MPCAILISRMHQQNRIVANNSKLISIMKFLQKAPLMLVRAARPSYLPMWWLATRHYDTGVVRKMSGSTRQKLKGPGKRILRSKAFSGKLLHLSPADLGCCRILHKVVDWHTAQAAKPSFQILDPHTHITAKSRQAPGPSWNLCRSWG